jgi:MFS family permease
MVSAILPIYLVLFLRLTPLQFGLFDGLYQGGASLLRVGVGFAADRWRRPKEAAAAGYGLSALSKLGMVAAGGYWPALAALVLLDRTGKGIRTAPRDALISLGSTPGRMATAFGVHRALDTFGAFLGPLAAYALLARIPNGFDTIFVVSFCFALVGLAVLVLFVENPPRGQVIASHERVSLGAAWRALRAPRYRALVVTGTLVGLATISDGFLYLGLQRRLEFTISFFPLLYVATSLCYSLLAFPVGKLADRLGRKRVFFGGYGLLVLVYLTLLLPSVGYVALFASLLLLGAYYAATDGVLMALTSDALPNHLRATGLGFLTTATSLARMLAAILFGALWTWLGPEVAIACFAAGLVLAALLAATILARPKGKALDA